MPAKVPKQVTIGGRVITVVVEDIEDWGQYRPDDRVIALSRKAVSKSSSLRETLRHEMLHAAFDISGVSYLKSFEEEAIVRCVDHIFHPAWDATRKLLSP